MPSIPATTTIRRGFLLFTLLVGSLALLLPQRAPRVSAGVDPNLASYAQNVLNRFAQYKGQRWVAGQQEVHWDEARKDEMTNDVLAATNPDQYPGMRGWDFPFGGGSGTNDPLTNDAQWMINTIISDWNTYKVLPEISQHWTPFATSQGTVHEDMFIAGDINDILNSGSGSTARQRYVAWRDNVADDLQQLEDAQVPVLWRPFHEAGGEWFWWDKDGSTLSEKQTNYKLLWNDLWGYLVNTKGLHNLIFVWTPGDKTTDTGWYPGDSTVDILGADIYDGSAPDWSWWYTYMGTFSSTKLRAISEQGVMMPASALSSAPFVFFMTWHTTEFDKNSSTLVNDTFNAEKSLARNRMSMFVNGTLPGANQAPGRTVTSSTSESSSYGPDKAVDALSSTRWASQGGSGASATQWLQIDLGSTQSVTRVKLSWEAAYATAYQIQTSNDASSWTSIYSTTSGDGGTDDLSVSGSGRYVRVYATTRVNSNWGYSLYEVEVYTTPACGTTNRATNTATASASSTDDATNRPASKAFDSNSSTRWASQYSDAQWIQIDLGATYTVCRVKLSWEAAYGRDYQVQLSSDGTTWTSVPIYSQTAGDGGVDDLTGLSGSGRYVRLTGYKRGSSWGYSLWDFEVYNS